MIPIRAPHEIEAIARAGAAVARCLERLIAAARPGVKTGTLDGIARRLIEQEGATALFPGLVQGSAPAFPGAICVCVNDEVTHGVPGSRRLEPGDLVTIDLGASLDGWCADASRAAVVGVAGASDGASAGTGEGYRSTGRDAEVVAVRSRLVGVATEATSAAIGAMGPGVRWSSAADGALEVVRRAGCRVVAGFAGHGVGRRLHEPPAAPMFPGPRDDFVLRPGMVLTVEPIVVGQAGGGISGRGGIGGGGVSGGGVDVVVGEDGWTVRTRDGADACQVEHTVAVTERGVRVLTA